MAAESLGLSSAFCFCVGNGETGPRLLGTRSIEFAVGIGYPRTDYDEMTKENFASERYDSTLLEPTRNRLEPWQPVDKAEFAESEPRPDFSDWVALTGFKDYIPDIHQVI